MIVAETQLLFKLQDKSEEPPWFIVAGVALKLLITQLAGGGGRVVTFTVAVFVVVTPFEFLAVSVYVVSVVGCTVSVPDGTETAPIP